MKLSELQSIGIDSLLNLKNNLQLKLIADEETKKYLEKQYIEKFNLKEINVTEKFYRARIWKHDQTKNYKRKEMGAPPPNMTAIGRAQPQGVSYLYTADQPDTAAAEVKPFIGAEMTIGTFNPIEKIKLLDISSPSTTELINSLIGRGSVNTINQFSFAKRLFAKPYHDNDPKKYWDTIFISELIKQRGVDGFIFDSIQKDKGKNYLFFNHEKLKCIKIKKYQVSRISLEIK